MTDITDMTDKLINRKSAAPSKKEDEDSINALTLLLQYARRETEALQREKTAMSIDVALAFLKAGE
jgi:hypothetical protein